MSFIIFFASQSLLYKKHGFKCFVRKPNSFTPTNVSSQCCTLIHDPHEKTFICWRERKETFPPLFSTFLSGFPPAFHLAQILHGSSLICVFTFASPPADRCHRLSRFRDHRLFCVLGDRRRLRCLKYGEIPTLACNLSRWLRS